MGLMKSLAIDEFNIVATRTRVAASLPVVILPIGNANELFDTELHVCEGLKWCDTCGRLLRHESEEYLTLESRYDRLLLPTEED